MLYTSLQTDGALFENAKFLVAHRHIVQGQQEYELIARDLVSLDLVQHRLSFLEQYQSFFILFLRYEIHRTFI